MKAVTWKRVIFKTVICIQTPYNYPSCNHDVLYDFRIMFGGNNLFVFIDPKESEKLKRKGKNVPDVTYEFAMSEIGRNAGLDTENGRF